MTRFQCFSLKKIFSTIFFRCRVHWTSENTIDIERKNRLLKVCYVPTTNATFLAFFLFFLLWSLTVLMKQTRQVVRAVRRSILLRCLWKTLNFPFSKFTLDQSGFAKHFKWFFIYKKVILPKCANFLYLQTYFWGWVCHAAAYLRKDGGIQVLAGLAPFS